MTLPFNSATGSYTIANVYKRRTPGAKRDPVKQWALSDKVFFACGACHILAFAFLEAYPDAGFAPVWIRPIAGHTGNHIIVARDDVIFDYHGYSNWRAYWAHATRRANQWWAGWDADLVAVRSEALVSNAEAREHDGLLMKEPRHFLFDPLPRAREYVQKFPAPPSPHEPDGHAHAGGRVSSLSATPDS